MENKKKLILDNYYDPDIGLVGSRKLYEKLKDKGVSLKDVRNTLKTQEIVQVNQKSQLNRSFVPDRPLQEFQIDLIYIENEHLNESRYGLCCIDAFTKKADVELMKKKTSADTVIAMENIFSRMGLPSMIYCDEGSEFNNAEFKKLMKENDIEIVFTLTHAPMVERFNRTLKEMISKYLQVSKSKTITRILPRIVKNYNNSYHSSIKMAPNEVDSDNEELVWFNLMKRAKKAHAPDIDVGDSVRVRIKPKSFDKKYKPQYSEKVHTIDRIKNGLIHVDDLNRKYLKAHVMKVGSVETHHVEPDIEGTREQHLKKIAKLPKPKHVYDEAESIVATRAKRVIKKPSRFTD
jgi:transposase InsO family protein